MMAFIDVLSASVVVWWGSWLAYRLTFFRTQAKEPLYANYSQSGGDSEFCFAARLLGYRIYYDPELQLIHYISKARLSFPYIKKLNYSFGYVTPILDCYKQTFHENPESIRPSLWFSEAKRQVNILAHMKKGLLMYFFSSREDMRIISVSIHLGRLTQLLSLRRRYASGIKESIRLFSTPRVPQAPSSKD